MLGYEVVQNTFKAISDHYVSILQIDFLIFTSQ